MSEIDAAGRFRPAQRWMSDCRVLRRESGVEIKDLLKTLKQRAIDQRTTLKLTVSPVTVVCRDEEIAGQIKKILCTGECVVVQERREPR